MLDSLTREVGYSRSVDGGHFQWAGPGIERMLGVTAHDLVTDPWLWEVRVEGVEELPGTAGDGCRLARFRWRCGAERILNVEDHFTIAEVDGQRLRVGVLRDVTDLVRAETNVAGERQRLELILEGTRLGTWDWDMAAGSCTVDKRWAAISGHTLDEVAPDALQHWLAMTHPDDLAELREVLQRHFDDELAYYDVEYRLKHRKGHWVWVHDRAKVIEWSPDGQPARMAGTTEDITRRRTSETAVREDVLLDPLTRLGNRRMLDARLDELTSAARVDGAEFGIVMIDIDHFKAINDNLGHLRGDAALKALAACIHAAIRPTDVAVRHAGDEFCVLLPDSERGGVALVADRLLEHVRRAAIAADTQASSLTVSIGAAHSGEVGRVDEQSVFRLADDRLYAAKRAGRDRVATSG